MLINIAKQAVNANKMNAKGCPKTVINASMQYGDKFDVPATKYGKAMEADAKNVL